LDDVCALIGRGGFENLASQTQDAFVLDPIDGTKGYVRGEQYAVCLGFLRKDGTPEIGVLGCPNLWAKDGGEEKGWFFCKRFTIVITYSRRVVCCFMSTLQK
jgi:3'(2'), 5'-bisphosphate nucleotidase